MGTTRLVQIIASKASSAIRSSAAQTAQRNTFRFGSTAVKDTGNQGKYMPLHTEPATPFAQRPAERKPTYLNHEGVIVEGVPPVYSPEDKLFAEQFVKTMGVYGTQWERVSGDLIHYPVTEEARDFLDDQNGSYGSHLADDVKAFSSRTQNAIPSGASLTVAGSVLAEATQKAEYNIPEKAFARDLILALEAREPRQHIASNVKEDFTKTIKVGPSPYKITNEDARKLVASESTNPSWQADLRRLASLGKVNHRSAAEAIRRAEGLRLDLAEYLRVSDFSAG